MLLKYLPSQYNGADYAGRRVYNLDFGGDGGDGGGGAAAQPTQISQLTIPEYAQPYMETLLGKAQALTSSPYQTYDQNRIAGPTAGQLAARSDVAGMEAPSQYQTATGLASQAGLQSLMGSQYMPGTFYSPQSRSSQLSQYQISDPAQFGSQQAQQYMSPYMQNVVDIQQREAIRAAQQGQLAQNLAAARQGTYGGARQLLATTERERNLGQQLGDIQYKGLQSAYENAQSQFERDRAAQMGTSQQNLQALLGVQQLGSSQSLQSQLANQQAIMQAQQMAEQSRQFGGTLGLQGAQTALQSALGLGQLGTAQQQSSLDLAKAQEAFGALDQQQQQQLMNLQYQDFLAQQQYPYKQLGFMSDLLRGSANLAGTGGTTMYQAPPSMTSQLAGTGLAAAGLYNLLK